MDAVSPEMLTRAIVAHPRSSLQDALLLFGVMIVAVLLALQYDLFSFAAELSTPQRKISLAEAIFLTALLAVGIFTFIIRRLREQRRDVALQAAAEMKLRELTALAMEDSLTGLLNRRALLSALNAAAGSLPSDGNKHALFMVDLNHFKSINDAHGHAVGDRVLEVVAERFRTAARPGDLVARLGGDEFAVLSYKVDRDTAYQIGLRFLEALDSPIRVEGHAHKVSMCIGAALIPDDGATADEVLRNADLALYRAKERKRRAVVFFEPAIEPIRQIS